MTQDTFLSSLRTALILIGTYMVGHNAFGHPVDANLWEEFAGAIMSVGSAIWGVLDKPTGIEGFQSAVRSVVTAIGGVALAHHLVTQENLNDIMALLLILIPVVQSYTSRLKMKHMAAGKIQVSDTGKAQPPGPKVS